MCCSLTRGSGARAPERDEESDQTSAAADRLQGQDPRWHAGQGARFLGGVTAPHRLRQDWNSRQSMKAEGDYRGDGVE
jgi:hypothetical protein